VRLNDGVNEDQFNQELTAFAGEQDIPWTTSNWRAGAGGTAEMSFGIQTVFNIIVLVISVVAIIIIMNTLVISVTERIPEIGTIRAIGGRKSFVRGMIIWETIIISGLFGLLGLGLGSLILGILNLTGIEATNIFLQLIFGGKFLKPVVSPGALLTSLLVIIGIGVASSLYPTRIALKIQPVQAMRKN
jgi:putative ABC transport system permease protein